jgi:hypothetical protein
MKWFFAFFILFRYALIALLKNLGTSIFIREQHGSIFNIFIWVLFIIIPFLVSIIAISLIEPILNKKESWEDKEFWAANSFWGFSGWILYFSYLITSFLAIDMIRLWFGIRVVGDNILGDIVSLIVASTIPHFLSFEWTRYFVTEFEKVPFAFFCLPLGFSSGVFIEENKKYHVYMNDSIVFILHIILFLSFIAFVLSFFFSFKKENNPKNQTLIVPEPSYQNGTFKEEIKQSDEKEEEEEQAENPFDFEVSIIERKIYKYKYDE